ncbi:MAG: benzoyl-CoA 2,3-epoxidase subunit BoxB [Gammaproteobacteria bacterium]|nr:MAG: benzoyl-CoA 2,3-epoxidase subunit BoxB [Gammaproteobacteria bacterium]
MGTNESSNNSVVEVNYDDLIPNNVDLANDAKLKKALEKWQPKFIDWWNSAGPEETKNLDVYLRTAVGVDPKGWAKFGHVKMPEYRWGILLAPKEEDRKIAFGKHKGDPVWQEVPGEYRALLRRLIVIQGDTEPASVEQQRYLSKTAPSLYDMRNLFQVNVEEGRHLWAMVYLLVKYFGRDGREEAEGLLERRSADEDKPRILGAFNEETPDWLSFFMFTYFTDRDGKMQLASLAESGFDPLSRSCRFMLTEEAHHMFVGETGVGRVIQRTCEAMNDAGITDPNDIDAVRKLGVIDLPTLQKRINFHVSVTSDLFGAEVSTNGAAAFIAGIKGRFGETKIDDDHVLENDSYTVSRVVDNELVDVEETAHNAINSRLLDDYHVDAAGGVGRWNKTISKAGFDFELKLPFKGFSRKVGTFSEDFITPEGEVVTQDQWNARRDEWFTTDADADYIQSLMKPCTEIDQYAGWIAPPRIGINKQPADFEYVKIN